MSTTTQNQVLVGQPVPNFSFRDTQDKIQTIDAYRGQRVILYFYPKDNTPGCTLESKAFTEHYNEFETLNTVIFGVSKDTLKSHLNFKAKYNMPFELITDSDKQLCALFDVLKPKSMFGKKYLGIERSTFLIDENGVLIKEWRKVKAIGHVKAVLAYLKTL